MRRMAGSACWKRCALVAVACAAMAAQGPMAAAQMPGQKMPGLTPETVTATAHGLHAVAGNEVMDVTACTDAVVHVVVRQADDSSRPSASRLARSSGRACTARS